MGLPSTAPLGDTKAPWGPPVGRARPWDEEKERWLWVSPQPRSDPPGTGAPHSRGGTYRPFALSLQ